MISAVEPEFLPFILYPFFNKSGPVIFAILASDLIILFSDKTYPLPISSNNCSFSINLLCSKLTSNTGYFDFGTIEAYIWSVNAIPGFAEKLLILKVTLAGEVSSKYSAIVKNLYPTSEELNPSPSVPDFSIPSTNISWLSAKGAILNPPMGVTNVHVTIPVVEEYSTLLTETPLELSVVKSS